MIVVRFYGSPTQTFHHHYAECFPGDCLAELPVFVSISAILVYKRWLVNSRKESKFVTPFNFPPYSE